MTAEASEFAYRAILPWPFRVYDHCLGLFRGTRSHIRESGKTMVRPVRLSSYVEYGILHNVHRDRDFGRSRIRYH